MAEKKMMDTTQVVRELRQRFNLVRRTVGRRLYMSKAEQSHVVEQFHRLYFESEVFGGTWKNTMWMGIPTRKCPLDLWVYQEMIHELRPDLVVETGTAWGGSALYLGAMCDLVGNGEVVSVDLAPKDPLPTHARVRYLQGSSVDPEILDQIRRAAEGKSNVVVILDSDHRCPHVLDELRLYSTIVPVGSYLVVEDTNVNGHPVNPDFGPGPMEAAEAFLAEQDSFVVDGEREKFYMTFNPNGFLKRVR